MRPILFLTLSTVLASCAPLPPRFTDAMTCAYACFAPGTALTAGHCRGKPEPVVPLDMPSCEDAHVRAPVDGESVIVGSRTTTIHAARWLTWTILDGRSQRGESGSGVYGADGALLAIVVENRDNFTYAWRLVP